MKFYLTSSSHRHYAWIAAIASLEIDWWDEVPPPYPMPSAVWVEKKYEPTSQPAAVDEFHLCIEVDGLYGLDALATMVGHPLIYRRDPEGTGVPGLEIYDSYRE